MSYYKHQLAVKYIFSFILIMCVTFLNAQIERINPHQHDNKHNFDYAAHETSISNDTSFDVKFYHIDVEIALDYAHISGSVNCLLSSLQDNLSSIKLDLDQAYTIDSISGAVASFSFQNNIINISLSESYNTADTFSLKIYYGGIPQMPGGYKGLRYETHGQDEIIIASLSTPFLAHSWWPCKDGTEDKSDSTFIDITIKDTTINNIDVIALSNGLLDTIINEAGKNTFKWKHKYPIVPYYVMVAISNYSHFQQIYEEEDYSFPIDYYVFASHIDDAMVGVESIPDAINFFTSIYGPYPFLEEKYGMTQLGYYGAIENQTNTIQNKFSTDWFYTSVHELAHQWFADMITCETWNHGWLNEGFASYSEALYHEAITGNYKEYVNQFLFYDGGSVYLYDVSDPFNIFQSIIYNKGAYVLHMIRGVMGDDDFFEAIYEYANDDDFMYKQATTEDFQLICEAVYGSDLNYFFDQWIYDEYFPMYAYNYEFDEGNGDLEITIKQAQLNLGRREIFTMPMQILIEFENGSDSIVSIFNDQQLQSFQFNFDDMVSNIELDPNDWILKSVYFDPDITVGVHNIIQKDFVVYPNPSNGKFTIRLEEDIFSENVDLQILDINSRLIMQLKPELNASNIIDLDLNNLNNGIYMISISSGNEKYLEKIVINR